MIFTRGFDISLFKRILLFLSTLIPFLITIIQKSVIGFNQSMCEALNNNFLDQYKLYLEILILLIIFVYLLVPFVKKKALYSKKSSIIVIGSMFLFLSVFGVTEYLSAITGYYEINLYALFIIPVFLVAITYSIFTLDIFNVKVVSTYSLVFGFIILVGSQLFFVSGITDRLLTILTIILSSGLGILLFRNLHKESEQRIYIEKLNVKLEALLAQRESLTHLVTHKVKGSFTRSKYIFAEMLEGTFGKLSKELKDMAEKGLKSDNDGIETVDLVLNAANLQTGTVKYEMKPVSFKEIVSHFVDELKGRAESKGLKFETDIKDGDYNTIGDFFWLSEVVHNLIDNSVKYTKEGSIQVGLEKKDNKILFYVKDSGVGINDEDKKNLFKEGGRGKNSVSVNVDSTGYGLFTVKLIVDAHKGRIWAESEGDNKGTTFFVELNG
jgi:signal transduction histidine kinase